MSENLEMPNFLSFSESDGRMGHFKIFEDKKVGHFEKKARDQF